MVTKDTLLQLIHHPEQIELSQLKELEALRLEFPYFQSIDLLLSKGYHTHKLIGYDKQLKETAVSIPNREVLYNLIYKTNLKKEIEYAQTNTYIEEEQKESITKEENIIEEPKNKENNTKIDELVRERKDENDKLEELILSHAIGSSYQLDESIIEEKAVNDDKEETQPKIVNTAPKSFYSWLTPNESIEREKPNDSIDDLVERFLKTKENEKLEKKDFFSPTNIAKISVVDQHDFVTETLANIYFEQKKYDKAIEAYEKLILKIPEKKPYFVDQIQKINDLLN